MKFVTMTVGTAYENAYPPAHCLCTKDWHTWM